jgi:hypothetical protein
MTQVWNPKGNYPRRVDRAPKPTKHEGPFYGYDLRRVIAPEPTDPSMIERAWLWWEDISSSRYFWWEVIVAVGCSVILAALIVL